MPPTIATALLLSLLADPGGSPAPGGEVIRARALRADLMFLAGDAFRGRLTATPENNLATEFVISRFDRLGLEPAGGNGSYSFRYNLATATPGDPLTFEVMHGLGASARRFAQGTEVFPHRISASGRASGRLAFAGFGIAAPDRGRDDYRGLDVTDRVVLVFDHEPGENDPASPLDGLVMSDPGTLLRKALAAQERGAVALLVVADVHNHPGPENFEALAASTWPAKPPRVERYSLQTWVEKVRIPVVQVARTVAEDLLRGSGRSLTELARAAEKTPGAGEARGDGVMVSLSADVRRHVVPDRSVLAAVEGSDPKLKDEWVVISCHHDHDGADGSTVFNGADDNGSGTVALLAIAEAYVAAARAGERPKRSVLFASFNSEERGLLGSWAFVEDPPVPLDRIVAVLNMDMIGRDEEVLEGGGPRFRGLPVQDARSNRDTFTLLGHSRSADLASLIGRANDAGGYGLTIKTGYDNNASNLLRRSDHWPFLQRGVPGVWFHTGLHPDYHTAGDRPEKIRYDKMERIARLVHRASWDLACQDGRPRLNPR